MPDEPLHNPADHASTGGFPPPLANAIFSIPMARPIALDMMQFPIARPDGFGGQITAGAARLRRWAALLQLVVLLIVGVVGMIGGFLIAVRLHLQDSRWEQVIAMFVAGSSCILVSLLLNRASGQRMDVIGWTGHRFAQNLGLGLACVGFVLAGLFIASIALMQLYPGVFDESRHARQAIRAQLPPMSLPVRLLMVMFVGLWEETVFRGFLLTRLYAICRRWWLTIPIGAVLFALGHGYQGPLAMCIIGMLGLFMGLVFVWTRSLVPVVVLHAFFDLIMISLIHSMPEGMDGPP